MFLECSIQRIKHYGRRNVFFFTCVRKAQRPSLKIHNTVGLYVYVCIGASFCKNYWLKWREMSIVVKHHLCCYCPSTRTRAEELFRTTAAHMSASVVCRDSAFLKKICLWFVLTKWCPHLLWATLWCQQGRGQQRTTPERSTTTSTFTTPSSVNVENICKKKLKHEMFPFGIAPRFEIFCSGDFLGLCRPQG